MNHIRSVVGLPARAAWIVVVALVLWAAPSLPATAAAPTHTVGAVTIAWNADDRKYGVVWTEGTRLHYRAIDDGGELDAVPVDTLLGTGSFDYVGTPLVWANERFAL